MGGYPSKPVTEKEFSEGKTVQLEYCVGAMQGWRPTMEDAHIAVVQSDAEQSVSLFGVFDGHGGAEVAKFCEQYMPGVLDEQLKRCTHNNMAQCLKAAFHEIDEMLRDARYAVDLESLKMKSQQQKPSPQSLRKRDTSKAGTGKVGVCHLADEVGCTAIVALLKGNDLWVASAGDSRGVMCRQGKAVALSEDHKPDLRGEYDRIVKAGGWVSQKRGDPRVNGELNLSRAIGDLNFKTNLSIAPKHQMITAEPDVVYFSLTDEDAFFVLACDGIWDVMSNEQVVNLVKERLSRDVPLKHVCIEILNGCLAVHPKRAEYGIGCDNMTFLLVELQK